MKKKESKLGIISTLMSLVPLIGVVNKVSYINANPGADEIPLSITLLFRTTTGIIPWCGLILGIVGLFLCMRKGFSLMGVVFNTFWIVFMWVVTSG